MQLKFLVQASKQQTFFFQNTLGKSQLHYNILFSVFKRQTELLQHVIKCEPPEEKLEVLSKIESDYSQLKLIEDKQNDTGCSVWECDL